MRIREKIMKKNKLFGIVLSVLSAAAAASLCAACGGGQEDLTLDRSAVTMDRYERTTLTVETGSGTVTWVSSEPTVASVDENGVITSLSEGQTVITATSGKSTAECTVTVESSGAEPILSQSWTTKELSVGETTTLGYSLTYKNVNVTVDAEFTVSVAKPNVLSKEADGTLKAISAGETKVTLSTSYCGWTGGVDYSVKVSSDLEPLEKPVAVLDGSTVSWSAIDGAETYTLKINGTECPPVTGTSVDLSAQQYAERLEKGNNTVAIKANATDENAESEFSEAVIYVHKVPFAAPVISLDGSVVSWTAPDEAEDYTLKINGKSITVTSSQIDLEDYVSDLQLGNNTVSVTVNAAGNNLASAASNTVTYEHKIPFEAPVIELNGVTVSWTAIAGAADYKIKINNNTNFSPVTGTEIDLSDEEYANAFNKGENTIAVKANGAGNYGDSAYSNSVTYVLKLQFVKPAVTLSGDTVSWEAVTDAKDYTLKIGSREITVSENSVNLLDAPYVSALSQGNNTISVKVNAKADGYDTDSEYSEEKTYFYRSPLEKPVNVVIEAGVLGWDEVEGAESYTLKINGELFENLEVTSVNLLATEEDYLTHLKLGEDNEISVKANATQTRRESEYCEPVLFDPLPAGTIIPTAERADTNLTYLPSYGGMNHVFKATIGPNREVMVLSDIATKYPDKEYVYFDIMMPKDFGTLVGIAYCTGDSEHHDAACAEKEIPYRHTSEAPEGASYTSYPTIDLSATTNENKVTAGWNTIQFHLAEQTKVGVGKHSVVSEVYITNIRFTEVPDGVIAPKAASGNLFRLDEYEGKTNVYQAKINNTAGSGEVTVLDRISTEYADKEFVYFDLWLPDIENLVGVAYCVGNSANHGHTVTRHTSQCSMNDSFDETYSTIMLLVTTNNKKLVQGWNTIKFKLSEQEKVCIWTYGSEAKVYISNIRFTEN